MAGPPCSRRGGGGHVAPAPVSTQRGCVLVPSSRWPAAHTYTHGNGRARLKMSTSSSTGVGGESRATGDVPHDAPRAGRRTSAGSPHPVLTARVASPVLRRASEFVPNQFLITTPVPSHVRFFVRRNRVLSAASVRPSERGWTKDTSVAPDLVLSRKNS